MERAAGMTQAGPESPFRALVEGTPGFAHHRAPEPRGFGNARYAVERAATRGTAGCARDAAAGREGEAEGRPNARARPQAQRGWRDRDWLAGETGP